MKTGTFFRAAAAASRLVMLLGVGVLFYSSGVQAQQTLDPETQTKVLKGFQIAPVLLNMIGKDPVLVGYGSYLVNASGDCNGCHTADPSAEYAPGGNPYLGQHATVNPASYLNGGQDFGAFPDPTGPFPHIVSRNLTPDKTGLPAGGYSLSQFTMILRTGADLAHAHPTCAGKPDGTCLPPPFNGNLLQIMPWPAYSNMTDFDISAIYAYLTAIPCLENAGGSTNRCGPAPQTVASALPNNVTVVTRQFQLDGTKSTSANGSPLTYLWTIPQGSPQTAILGATTATPTVQLGPLRGPYAFQLTVKDSAGNTATAIATLNFQGN